MAGRYRALLIGNSTYLADEHNLQALKGPVKDIAVLNRALIDRDTGLFADVNVALLPEATSARAIRALGRFFGAATRDDVLLVYFSGHGKLDQSGRLHLCMQDTDSTDLLSTAVSSARIIEFADGSKARNVVIVLDCCHAGAFRGGELADAVAGPGRYVMTSCRGTQLANDATVENGTSFFTQHLVNGLIQAAADQDGDGYVTFSDLYAYVDRRLREAGKQIPLRRVDGDGDVRLARRPQPAPAEVAVVERSMPEVSSSRPAAKTLSIDDAYELGERCRREDRRADAMTWYEQAANGGHRDAAYQLGELSWAAGKPAEAKPWFKQAANQGHVYAAYQLGMLLWKTEGDPARAEKWFRRAAKGNERKAAYELGELLWAAGKPAEAKPWFKQAANQGHVYAAYRLGMLLWKTEGDPARAENWLRKAADGGERKAISALVDLKREPNDPK